MLRSSTGSNPGVVAIKITTDQGGGLGSGFIFDIAGHVVTNYHVVEGATQLEVDFPPALRPWAMSSAPTWIRTSR